MDTGIIQYINRQFDLSIQESLGEERLIEILSHKINELIENDFSRLVQLLYSIDVSEQKLKSLLRENPDTDAGRIIAHLILERQKQKLQSKEIFRQNPELDDSEEKW
ncbi:MAG: hypothetical protein JST02_08505 [Bacteroidetes bacterium]|nr:hypothetical protein [Bacteroidota bacterium]